jgi:succinate dehydrogenase/fumarate reductase-like Fe-S protein
MDPSSGKRRITAEERAKSFEYGRCLYCGGCNHRAAECVARKKAQTFNASGAADQKVGTKEGSVDSGRD